MATMTRTSWREPRQRIIHDFVADHVDSVFTGSGMVDVVVVAVAPPGPPGSVDCILSVIVSSL